MIHQPTFYRYNSILLAVSLGVALGTATAARAADLAAPALNIAGQTVSKTTLSDTHQPGLVTEIYQLPVRPRSLRNPIPGLAAAAVRIADTPNISSEADLEKLTNSVQAEFIGEILAPTTGDYLFSGAADDAMELQIDGKTILTNAWINGNNAPTLKPVRLTKGWHPIHVRFYQGDGGFGLTLDWQMPGATKTMPIPAAQFRVSSAQVALSQSKKTVDAVAESKDPAHAHRAVFRSTGFFELPERDGDLLVETLEGPTLYSEAARADFAQLAKATNYQSLPAWHQVMVLAGFLRGWHSESTKRGPVANRAIYQLSAPQATPYEGWHGAQRQGFQSLVTIGEQKFTIYTPAADSPERENAAQALAGLPTTLRVPLKRITVEPYGTANEFNGGGDRIWVRLGRQSSLEMLDNTLSHEIGHVLMNRTDAYLLWQAAIAQDTASVSHYGRLNPSEDFAEFMRLYLSTNDDAAQLASLRQIFPARMAVMEGVLKGINFDWQTG